MSPDHIIRQLTKHRHVFQHYLEGAIPPEYTWRMRPTAWCLLEIVSYLRDKEIEDFRSRVAHCLEQTGTPLPIDSDTWVQERPYLQGDYGTVLQDFLHARDASIAWLGSLREPDWTLAYEAPQEPRSAEFFLTNWLAHDYLYLRSITHLQYHYLRVQQEPLGLTYAGSWD
ncbi:MAG: hypothetical protein AAFW73_00790 [Bacteroidota bacterium]